MLKTRRKTSDNQPNALLTGGGEREDVFYLYLSHRAHIYAKGAYVELVLSFSIRQRGQLTPRKKLLHDYPMTMDA